MKKNTHRVEIYRASDGWRWRVRAANGNIVADSAEAYCRRGTLRRSLAAMAFAFARSTVTLKEYHQ